MHRVPISVKVLSIIGIVLASLSLLGGLCGALLIFTPILPLPEIEPLRHDVPYLVIGIISFVIGSALSILLLAGSIGSLRLRPWARLAMIVYAIILPIETVAFAILNLLYLAPHVASITSAPAAPAAPTLSSGLAGAACSFLLWFSWAGCILFFFTRTNVINAFHGIFPAPPTAFPILDPSQPPADLFP
ncbi:MAG TPA: hypothetical protein VHQ47_19905 [Phycisphaerae bacterium]|nr:hypothetical protein [Phycisphaerae bacterium]